MPFPSDSDTTLWWVVNTNHHASKNSNIWPNPFKCVKIPFFPPNINFFTDSLGISHAHPDHTYFSVLTCLSPGMLLPQNIKLKIRIKNIKEKRTQVQFGLSVYSLDQQHGLYTPTWPPVASLWSSKEVQSRKWTMLWLVLRHRKVSLLAWLSKLAFRYSIWFVSLSIMICLSASLDSSHLSHSVAHTDLRTKLRYQVFLLPLLLICTFFSLSMAHFSFCSSPSS